MQKKWLAVDFSFCGKIGVMKPRVLIGGLFLFCIHGAQISRAACAKIYGSKETIQISDIWQRHARHHFVDFYSGSSDPATLIANIKKFSKDNPHFSRSRTRDATFPIGVTQAKVEAAVAEKLKSEPEKFVVDKYGLYTMKIQIDGEDFTVAVRYCVKLCMTRVWKGESKQRKKVEVESGHIISIFPIKGKGIVRIANLPDGRVDVAIDP